MEGSLKTQHQGPVMNGAFFIVSGMPRFLEIISPMHYDVASLIQIAPGRSVPEKSSKMEESFCIAQMDSGQRLRSGVYTRVSGFNP
jgi:hypothetical protein